MDCKAGLLFFIILLIGSFALPAPEDDMSVFFDHTDANARIIGGTEVAAGTHSHMVALIVGVTVKNFICGGSLLTQRTVLTAAHCVDNVYGINWVIRSARVAVGSTRWDSGTDYSILRNVTHPDYNRCIVKNDISVLITASNVVLNSLVQPVALTYEHIDAGVPSIVAGWGVTKAGDYTMSEVLIELPTTTIGNKDCVSRVSEAAIQEGYLVYVDPSLEICTFHSPGFGVCSGDSGSALRRADNGHQFGIVSWGFPCALGHPDVFVRISAYESWLKTVIV